MAYEPNHPTEEEYRARNEFLSAPESTIVLEKIHPCDMYVVLKDRGLGFRTVELGEVVLIDGKVYLQTTCVPVKTEEGKWMSERAKKCLPEGVAL